MSAPAQEAPKRRRTFFERGDIRAAMRALDVWASCKHARAEGARGLPTFEAIFDRQPEKFVKVHERHEGEIWDPRERRLRKGVAWIEVERALFTPSHTERVLPPAQLIEMQVDAAIAAHGHPLYWETVGLALYPRSGPYERSGGIEEHPLVAGATGRKARRVSSAMRRAERELLAAVAGALGRFVRSRPEAQQSGESASEGETPKIA